MGLLVGMWVVRVLVSCLGRLDIVWVVFRWVLVKCVVVVLMVVVSE